MNEFLRVLDRLLKKGGYAIKRHPEYNLLPLSNFNQFPAAEQAYAAFNGKNKQQNDNVDCLEVCLRTCINDKRAQGKRSELTGVSLEEHLLTCIKSLISSISLAHEDGLDVKLTVFDDRSNVKALDSINALCEPLGCDWQVVTTEKTGQGASLHQHFNYARNKDALFYFCEDDYLHTASAITEMVEFYQTVFSQTGSHLLIHPQEHELIYSQYNYPSYVLSGKNRRWRTISHATHTFFTHSKVVQQYWEYFENTKFVGIKEKGI